MRNPGRFVLTRAGIVNRHVAPQHQKARSRLAVDEYLSPACALRGGDDAIVNLIIVGEGQHAYERPIACTVGGQDADKHHIVIDG